MRSSRTTSSALRGITGARRRTTASLCAAATVLGAGGLATPAVADPARDGRFDPPFAEPTINGTPTDETCLGGSSQQQCKPAGATVNVLPGGKVLYWNALEGTERNTNTIVADFGRVAVDDQSRVVDPVLRRFSTPSNATGGANPNGYAGREPLVPGATDSERGGEGALFCSDQNFLPDGRVLVTGGTAYYNDPGVDALPVGVVELEGIKNTRIYDPATDDWTQSGDTAIGRWYPTLVTQGDGQQFVASGVQKLLKPVYTSRPEDSGTNVRQTETYDPNTGRWTRNPSSADKSLPLFPRLHLLPDGDVFYNAAGQAFNPFGQSYDEALWNVASTYDPKTRTWTDLGVPGAGGAADPAGAQEDVVGGLLAAAGQTGSDAATGGVPGGGEDTSIPGFRGSTFSLMMPLRPDADGQYTKAQFLTAGGVLNPANPGSYVATSDSRLTTIDTAGGRQTMTDEPTGDLNAPRWYPTGVLLPTGEAMAFSGADRDGVVAPGTEIPNKTAELYDPATQRWTEVAEARRPRTYHNTAALLPDGRVLIGGHAIISTLYSNNYTVAPGVTAPYDGRDPTFEIYSPPYLFRGGPRPEIVQAPQSLGYGAGGRGTFDVTVKGDASAISSVVVVRNPSLTHLVDGDQRSVELPVVARNGSTVTVKAPPNGNVLPPGPYMLFVNAESPGGGGLVPSVSAQVRVGQECLPRDNKVSSFGIRGQRLRVTRPNIARRAEVNTPYAAGHCVDGGGQVTTVYAGKQGRGQLQVTTAKGYAARRIAPGSSWARARKLPAGKRAKRSGLVGVHRVDTGATNRIYGVSRGRVQYVGVVESKYARQPKSLRKLLRRAGIRATPLPRRASRSRSVSTASRAEGPRSDAS